MKLNTYLNYGGKPAEVLPRVRWIPRVRTVALAGQAREVLVDEVIGGAEGLQDLDVGEQGFPGAGVEVAELVCPLKSGSAFPLADSRAPEPVRKARWGNSPQFYLPASVMLVAAFRSLPARSGWDLLLVVAPAAHDGGVLASSKLLYYKCCLSDGSGSKLIGEEERHNEARPAGPPFSRPDPPGHLGDRRPRNPGAGAGSRPGGRSADLDRVRCAKAKLGVQPDRSVEHVHGQLRLHHLLLSGVGLLSSL
jgi:hypothetical protein